MTPVSGFTIGVKMAKNRVPGKDLAKRLQQGADADFSVEGEESPETVKVTPDVKKFERSFSKVKKIVSDVFKLLPAPVVKGIGVAKHPNIDPADFKEFEHTHIFRTFDTEGRRHAACVPTAAHFHEIEWDYDPETNLPVIKSVSGPKQWVQKMLKGKWTKVAQPANDYDFHTHDFEYLQSHEVSARMKNVEAEKVIALEANKGANPGGVIER